MSGTKLSCLLAALALGAFCFSACGGKPTGSKIRFGSVHESLASDEAFYSIVGGSDYSRLPLLRPWHVIELNKELDLMNETTGVLSGLVDIGAKGGVFFGTAVAKGDEGRTMFWALSPTEHPGFPAFKEFASREEWIAHLGFTPPQGSLQTVKSAVSSFGKGADPFAGGRK